MRTDCLVLSSLRRRAEGRAARNHLLCRQPERHAAPAVSGAHAAHARAVGARRQIHRVARKFRHFAPPARSSLSPSPPCPSSFAIFAANDWHFRTRQH